MPKILYRCNACWRYTFNTSICPRCGSTVIFAHPAKYSPEDRFGKYRRLLKREQGENRAFS